MIFNLRFFVFVLALTFDGSFAYAESLKRLDPHGPRDLNLKGQFNLKKHSECTTCHTPSAQGFGLKANAKTSCTDCHGSAPHSGVAEHMGRVHKGQLLNCLSCHAPHRASQVQWDKPMGFFSKPVTPPVTKGFSKFTNPNPMLKRKCTECHQW